MQSRIRARTHSFPWLEPEELYPFPDPRDATPEGVVAVGGNLSPGMLLSAYSQGIFPWFSEGDPILWWSPDPRFVLRPAEAHRSRRMQRILRSERFTVRLDTQFAEVIGACAEVPRRGQDGTWITEEMKAAYIRLHELGFAHSCETYLGARLVGGLYGVALGRIFFGESMFASEDNASKAAFLHFAGLLDELGFTLIDSQVYTPHLASLGAHAVPRTEFLEELSDSIRKPTIRGPWSRLAS